MPEAISTIDPSRLDDDLADDPAFNQDETIGSGHPAPLVAIILGLCLAAVFSMCVGCSASPRVRVSNDVAGESAGAGIDFGTYSVCDPTTGKCGIPDIAPPTGGSIRKAVGGAVDGIRAEADRATRSVYIGFGGLAALLVVCFLLMRRAMRPKPVLGYATGLPPEAR